MDELLKQAIKLTIEHGAGSTSLLQRKLVLGYNKAESLMIEMEQLGIVAFKLGGHPRKLLVEKYDTDNTALDHDEDYDDSDECCDECGCYHSHYSWCRE